MARSPFSAASLSSLLRSFASSQALSQAKQTHTHLLVHNLLPNVTLETDLLLVYGKCGVLKDARQMFDGMVERNMHSWNIMIASYASGSLFPYALSLFDRFLKMGLRPDHFTLPPAIKASAGVGDSNLGKALHSLVVRLGFEEYVIMGSSLLDFYSKLGDLILAERVFVNLSWRDSGVWNSMISGFGKAGFSADALNYFREMLREGVKMDHRTVPSIINACGKEGDLRRGKEIHGQVMKSVTLNRDVAIGNSIIDMYAKCGFLGDSEKVFSNMYELNVVSWTTMMSCYGIHGKGEKSLMLFNKMRDCGFRPNCVTLTAILASCSHSGLIHQGRRVFDSISLDFGFEPSAEHYTCMVDLLGRFGHLEEALELIKNAELDLVASIWGALLAGCVMHRNVNIGETAAYYLFALEPDNTSNYVALCSIYESLHMLDAASRIRTEMRKLGLVKIPGSSWVTIGGRLCKFYQGSLSRSPIEMICEGLDAIIKEQSLDYIA